MSLLQDQSSLPKPPPFSPVEAGLRVQEWFSVMELSHELLMAGIRSRLKPGEDEWTVYRRWYQEQLNEHQRTIEQMARRFTECLAKHDSKSSQ